MARPRCKAPRARLTPADLRAPGEASRRASVLVGWRRPGRGRARLGGDGRRSLRRRVAEGRRREARGPVPARREIQPHAARSRRWRMAGVAVRPPEVSEPEGLAAPVLELALDLDCLVEVLNGLTDPAQPVQREPQAAEGGRLTVPVPGRAVHRGGLLEALVWPTPTSRCGGARGDERGRAAADRAGRPGPPGGRPERGAARRGHPLSRVADRHAGGDDWGPAPARRLAEALRRRPRRRPARSAVAAFAARARRWVGPGAGEHRGRRTHAARAELVRL